MTSEEKHQFWQRHIEAWLQSQQTQKDYCNQHNLTLASFGYWRTRLKRKPLPDKKLIPIAVSKSFACVSIFLPTGVRLEVPAPLLADILPVISQAAQDIG